MSAEKSRISPKSKRGTPGSSRTSNSPKATSPASSPTSGKTASPGVQEKTVTFRGEGLAPAPEADQETSTGTGIQTTSRTITSTSTSAATTTSTGTSTSQTATTTTTSTAATTTTTTVSASAAARFSADRAKDAQSRTLGSGFDSTAQGHAFSKALQLTLSKHCKEVDSSNQDDFIRELGRLIEKISFTSADMQGFAREVVKQLADRTQRDPDFASELQVLRKRLPSDVSDDRQEPVESTILKLLEILVEAAETPKYFLLGLVLATLDAELHPADFTEAGVATPATEKQKKKKKSAEKRAEAGKVENQNAFLRTIRRLSMPFIALASPKQRDSGDTESSASPGQLDQGEEEKTSTTESECES